MAGEAYMAGVCGVGHAWQGCVHGGARGVHA